jgi:hypothetical protein
MSEAKSKVKIGGTGMESDTSKAKGDRENIRRSSYIQYKSLLNRRWNPEPSPTDCGRRQPKGAACAGRCISARRSMSRAIRECSI